MGILLRRWVTSRGCGNAAGLSALIGLVALAAVTFGSVAVTNTVTNMMTILVGVMALAAFSGNSGALSFGHTAFMAIGAQVSATLTIAPAIKSRLFPLLPDILLNNQFHFIAALIITVVLVGLVAAIAGLAVMRLSLSTIPIATLGLLIIVNSVIIGADGVTRGSQAVYGIPKDVGIATATVVAVLATCFVALFKESASGLALRATREDEAASASVTINPRSVRFLGWIISGAIAGGAGALIAHNLSIFSPKDFYFDLTFYLIVMLVVGGINSVSGALVGTLSVTALIEVLRRFENGFSLGPLEVPQIFGLTTICLALLILSVLYFRPGGLLGYRELVDLIDRRPDPAAAGRAPAGSVLGAKDDSRQHTLQVDNISKQYGGVKALSGVSITVSSGDILGLIGPNGSGKSTFVACISGTQRCSAGSIQLDGQELAAAPSHAMAQRGIARNFQNIRLFANMTVLENVLVAVLSADRNLSHADARTHSMALLHWLDIESLAARRSGDLAYGQQRRVEIARALAIRPTFLLLDEPAAGMNEDETQELLEILDKTLRETSIGLIIIDHDMPLMMRLCKRLVVLNRGAILAEGSPLEIQDNEAVREAYFGRRRSKETGAQLKPKTETIA